MQHCNIPIENCPTNEAHNQVGNMQLNHFNYETHNKTQTSTFTTINQLYDTKQQSKHKLSDYKLINYFKMNMN